MSAPRVAVSSKASGVSAAILVVYTPWTVYPLVTVKKCPTLWSGIKLYGAISLYGVTLCELRMIP